MAKNDGKIAGMNGPLRSPAAATLVNKGTLNPSIGANTTIPGTAPKAALIQSFMNGSRIVRRND